VKPTKAENPRNAVLPNENGLKTHEGVTVTKRRKRFCKPSVVGSNPTTGSIRYPRAFTIFVFENARRLTRSTLDAAKLREREAKARLAEMEADEKEGKLLELSVVQQTCGNICTAFTARLANFGDGLASICHNQPGDFVAQRINEGLRSALRELSKMPYVPNHKE